MKYSSKQFIFGNEAAQEQVGEGIIRQILGFDDSLMMARVCFESGAAGYVHSHHHSQLTYVESGSFEFQIGDQTRLLKTGDCAYIPPNIEHGTTCNEAGVLLDVFSPIRDDFFTEN